ncbi:hypothetical protein [uncultured Endozoicomonas sp.]|uniref:hypothetical protein n=1 Tax=uncultured Endozoicomonas sp. TaxID=432652 RepID=UPI0026082979|nr:hypothetical protein [uncultured Endozoicomonas sp.]
MAVLRSLVTTLGMNSAQYRADLKKAQKSTGDFSAQVKKVAGVSATAFAAVATAAAAAATVLVKESLASNDALAKFADKIGIATDALGGLQHAGELTGVSTQTMNMGLQRMTRRVADAASGTGEAVKALEELGISAVELNRLSPDEQFKQIAEAMGDVDGRANQVRLAFKLFDSEGVGLLNTLDAGAEGINAMMQEADALGATMNRVDAAKLEAANDAMYKAGLGSKALGNTLAVAVSPYIVAISDQFTAASKASNGFKDEVTSGMEFVAQAIGYTANVVHGLNVVWEIVEQGVREFVGTAVYNLAELDKAVTDLLNKLPGVQAETNQALQLMADVMVDDIQRGRDELSALLNEPLPHQAVQEWFANVRAESDKAAQAVAENRKALFAPPAANDPAGDDSGDTGGSGSDRLGNSLDQLRTKYADENQLLLDKTLAEQEILIASEAALLLSEQESQLLRQQSWQAYYDVVNQAATDSAQKQVDAQHQAKIAALKQQSEMYQNSSQLFGNMADLSKTFAGEQSGIYKAMFAVSKAFAIADSIVSIQAGIAEAARLPFPANLGAMATVAASTANIVSTIQGTNMQGMAHDGIDSIPKEGTWLLDKGERVVDSRTNADLKSYLANNQQSASNNVNWTIIVNEAEPGTEVHVDEQRQTIEITKAEIMSELHNDFTGPGPLRRALGV